MVGGGDRACCYVEEGKSVIRTIIWNDRGRIPGMIADAPSGNRKNH